MATKAKTTRPVISLKKATTATTTTTDNAVGSGYKPRDRYRAYSFDSLKKKGDYFVFTDVTAEKSLRSQASKQKAIRGVDYRVEKTAEINGKKFKNKVLVVIHDGNIL